MKVFRSEPAPAAETRDALLDRLATRAARRGFAIAMDLVGNAAEAEDVVQEALVRACDSFDQLADHAALDAWYFRIVTRLCLGLLRRRKLWRWVRWWSPDSDDGDAAPDLASADPAPDDMLAGRRQAAALTRALGRLPDRQRAALVLRYGHELPVPEIAAMLGVGPATAKTHLVRGLERLRQLMEEPA